MLNVIEIAPGLIMAPVSPEDMALSDDQADALYELDCLGASPEPAELEALMSRLAPDHPATRMVRGYLHGRLHGFGGEPWRVAMLCNDFAAGFWTGWILRCQPVTMGKWED